jgi:RNA polymerase sigma-32 factor
MSTRIYPIDATLPVGSLQAYIYRVNQIPILTAEEEFELAHKFRTFGDLEAAKKLVMANLRFVVRVASNYLGYGLAHADLIQEGTIGLMKAVKRFNPEMGVRLVSFAIHWIKAEIHEFVLRNWRIVKIATTKAQRKLFFNLRKLSNISGWLSEKDINAISETLNVSPADVKQMEMRLGNIDEAIEGHSVEDDTKTYTPLMLEDHRFRPDVELEQQNLSESHESSLKEALTKLDERSLDILRKRWLDEDKMTLHELANKYNISAERVRQLEKQAMAKLKSFITY